MKISDRANNCSPFYALEFGHKAAALEAQGHHVIKLSIGEPDFGAPPAVRAAMKETMDGRALSYTAALGDPRLRQAIANFYRGQHDLDISPSRVVVTSGASAALLLVLAGTTNPGDEVLMGDPSYPCNRQLVKTFGARVTLVPTSPETNFQPDAASVRARWSASTVAIMIATPANPTGTSIAADELAAICSWAREHDAWRIVDEIYLNLSDRDDDGRPPRSVLSIDNDAIVINSFSKYFGMTGWRLGWCIVPEDFVPAIERLSQNYFLCPSAPAQQAALACFTPQSLAICEERRTEFVRRRALVIDRLQRAGLRVLAPPDGAFYLYIDIRHTGMSAWDFCSRALVEAHVALTPGKDFGPQTADTHIRISYAASTEDLREGLERLHLFVDRLLK